jgi:muramoyltetrapeptide carboxypeptidase
VPLPPAAGPGDRVGVAALSGPVDPGRLERGLAALSALGFVPVVADNVSARRGLFAGSDAERLAGFHRLAADRDLPIIFFARGGHGALRLLPGIDWQLLARRPRAYVGYSDLTPFLLAVVRRLGWAAFHGPLVAAELARGLGDDERESLLAALAGRYPVEVGLGEPLRWPGGGAAAVPGAAPAAAVEGPLLGGCLSLLAATVGTPWLPDLAGALLFWEDVNEAPYRIDRMLTHLALSGNLDNIAGMIVGHLDALAALPRQPEGGANGGAGGGRAADASRVAAAAPDWPALVGENLDAFAWPLAWGLDSGHRAPNLTLPLGLAARLDAAGRRLALG